MKTSNSHATNPAQPAAPELEILKAQQSAVREENLSHQQVALRRDRLQRAIKLLTDNQQSIVAAIDDDFGGRSKTQSRLVDVLACVSSLHYSQKQLEKWLSPEERSAEPLLASLGARAQVSYQALGSVGIIAPWNFPVNLLFSPLASVFAAGNRAILKPSEMTPATSVLIAKLVGDYFESNELAVVTGDAETARRFCALPFDHLVFTGSGSIAREVSKIAADNLTPLTLELGGKCPVVIDLSADLELAARRIMAGKLLNAGQICLAPDYVLVAKQLHDDFIQACQRSVASMYPDIINNDDYCSIINQRHYKRLQHLLDDADYKGAMLHSINPAHSISPADETIDANQHKLVPVLLTNVNRSMKVMQDEIFGPLLPIIAYQQFDDCIAEITGRDKPLALYYFGEQNEHYEQLLAQTQSGGVSVNDVIAHYQMEDLPFGGIGPSGMGAYHGIDGFRRFSHARAIYHQTTNDDVPGLLRPPYSKPVLQDYLAGKLKGNS